ncbi:MAG: anti-sigma factor family protein [Pyrinomonadaceae bacterium]
MKKCYELGEIQAFLDGELSSIDCEILVRHCSLCDSCSKRLSEAEQENAEIYSLLEAELNPLVPTERLRSKVFASINEIEQKENAPVFVGLHKYFQRFGIFGISPVGAAFAVFLLVFTAAFVTFSRWNKENPNNDSIIANNTQRIESNIPQVYTGALDVDDEVESSKTSVSAPLPSESSAPRVANSRSSSVSYASFAPQRARTPKVVRKSVQKPIVYSISAERKFLTKIDSLTDSVNRDKDYLMTPKERIGFEKNLAIVNESIKRMKQAVKEDPKNNIAKELLKNSYQNKVDLLSSVSERSELVAGIN